GSHHASVVGPERRGQRCPLVVRRTAAVWCLPLVLAGSAGCAPVAPYHGPVPAPGAAVAFSTRPADEAARSPAGIGAESPPSRRLDPGDPDRRLLGTLAVPARSDSIVVLLYGDNRPGYRLQSRKRELQALRGLRSSDPG